MEVGGAGRRRGRPPHTWGWEDRRGRGRLLFARSSAPTRTGPLGSCAWWGGPRGIHRLRSVEPPLVRRDFSAFLCPRSWERGRPGFIPFFFPTERGNLTRSPAEFYHPHYLQTGFRRRFGFRVRCLTLDAVFPAFTAI